MGLIICIALILAISEIAMKIVKIKDRRDGLYLDDGEYTIAGTIRSCIHECKERKKKREHK